MPLIREEQIEQNNTPIHASLAAGDNISITNMQDLSRDGWYINGTQTSRKCPPAERENR